MKGKFNLILVLMVSVELMGAEIGGMEVMEFTEVSTFELPLKCHPWATWNIYIEPMHPSATRWPGTFSTTNSALTWAQICNASAGTNRIIVQTVCAGITGAVSAPKLFVAHRMPPPPEIKFRRKPLATYDAFPPLPFGFPTQPLPGGRNIEYQERLKTEAAKIGLNADERAKFKLHRSQ